MIIRSFYLQNLWRKVGNTNGCVEKKFIKGKILKNKIFYSFYFSCNCIIKTTVFESGIYEEMVCISEHTGICSTLIRFVFIRIFSKDKHINYSSQIDDNENGDEEVSCGCLMLYILITLSHIFKTFANIFLS